jgi:energy-coupling factor transporter ATP-binding protein EcfA2
MMERTNPVVELFGVTKTYPGGARALDGVSLAFGAASLSAVMGPSGSGKSTLLHCAAGLDRPDAGGCCSPARRSAACANRASPGRAGSGSGSCSRRTTWVTALDDFLDAVERVAAGGTAMDPEVVRQLFTRGGRSARIDGLTGREREVLALMAQGLSNSAICATLFWRRCRWGSTSRTSSPSSTCRPPPTPTGGYGPCSPTSTSDPSRLPRRVPGDQG